MNKYSLRILLVLLALCMLMSVAACNGSADGSSETTPADIPAGADVETTPAETTTAAPVSFSLTKDYVIVRPDDMNGQEEIDAVQLLMRGIKSAYGVNCNIKTDFTRANTQFVPGEFEILVGPTNRPESMELDATLKYYDWAYSVVSPNVIAICGGSPEATYAGVEAFLKNVIGYEENADESVKSAGNAVALTTGTLDGYAHTYSVSSLKLGDRDINEYTLVAKSVTAAGVSTVTDAIERLTGVSLKVAEASEFSGGPAIYFGCADKDGSHLDVAPFGSSRYYIVEQGEDIIIDFKSSGVGKTAAAKFVQEYIPTEGKGEVTVKLGRGQITAINIPKGTNSLKLETVTESTVAEGIVYEERLYRDPDGNPVRAYIITVAKGAASFYTSTPNDGTETGKVSNMKNQITAAENAGKKVIAGVNADFFDMGGTNITRGLCIKDGVVMTGAADRPWLGITKDGEVVMGLSSEYEKYKGNLVHAVGGSHIMLRSDNTSNIAVGTEFADTRHPRTAVGTKPDGSVVIMVVDGRQSSISNGASLADLAEIFSSMGCDAAINLDGGGSSTFVLKNSKGEFVVENSPSAGALRAVANGLLVIEN